MLTNAYTDVSGSTIAFRILFRQAKMVNYDMKILPKSYAFSLGKASTDMLKTYMYTYEKFFHGDRVYIRINQSCNFFPGLYIVGCYII